LSQRTVKLVAIALLFVVAVGGAAALAYFAQQRRIEQLTAELGSQRTELDALTEKYDARVAQAKAEDATATPTSNTTPAGAPADAEQPKPEPTTSRQFAFVRKTTQKDDKVSLVVDFAQYLTGSAAEKAAAEAGDETPPPNDYYISNTNPKLRTFGVADDARFVMAGADPADTETMTADEFYKAIKHNSDGAQDSPYWFTITNGVITAGEEQWTP